LIKIGDCREPRSLEINMNDFQVKKPFPSEHPQASQISRKVVFPDYSAPEDPRTGEKAIRSKTDIKSFEAKAHPDPVIVVAKSFGNPWRHEIQHLPLQTQKEGAWWIDQPLYQASASV
jgi:hypothetical protein